MIAQTDLSDVLDRYRAGEPLASIAADYGVTPQAVSYHARKLGGPKRRRGAQPRTDLDLHVDEMVRLYRSGHTTHEIGDRLGCDNGAVLVRLRRAGVRLRRANHPPALSSADRIRLRADYDLGHTYAELASDHGVSDSTVRRYIAAERERLAKHSSPTPQMTPGWRRRRRGGDT